jgi:hypothetical protein
MLRAHTRPYRGLQLLGFDERRRVFDLRVKLLVSILGNGDVDLLRRSRGCRRRYGDNGRKQKTGHSLHHVPRHAPAPLPRYSGKTGGVVFTHQFAIRVVD